MILFRVLEQCTALNWPTSHILLALLLQHLALLRPSLRQALPFNSNAFASFGGAHSPEGTKLSTQSRRDKTAFVLRSRANFYTTSSTSNVVGLTALANMCSFCSIQLFCSFCTYLLSKMCERCWGLASLRLSVY